jgi:hypothetical protein
MLLRVFENRGLRRIFELKRGEVTGDWRKLHNEELHNFYSTTSIIRILTLRRTSWAGQAAQMGRSWKAYRIYSGEPEGKRPLGRPIRTVVDNIIMDLTAMGGMVWIDLAQDRDQLRALVKTVKKTFRFYKTSGRP